MNNVETLRQKLLDMGVRDFHVTVGEPVMKEVVVGGIPLQFPSYDRSINELTEDQAAGVLTSIERVEAGECEEVSFDDDPQVDFLLQTARGNIPDLSLQPETLEHLARVFETSQQ